MSSSGTDQCRQNENNQSNVARGNKMHPNKHVRRMFDHGLSTSQLGKQVLMA